MKRLIYLFSTFLMLVPGCITLSTGGEVGPLKEQVLKKGDSSAKILIINMEGPIFDGGKTNFLGDQTDVGIVSRVKEELDKAASDKNIRALIIKLNTPGGEVTTCDIIHHEIVEFKKRKPIPVIAEMSDICASGGVYISSAADKIIAHPTTVTGSIGVIAQTVNLKELFDKIGVKGEAIKSGDKKDMGSIFRPMTDKERTLFQEVINIMYERFLTVIMDGRKINEKKLREIADGRIFMAQRSLEYGLIDKIGYSEDTISMAENAANISNAAIVTYTRPGKYVSNYYSEANFNNYGTLNLVNINADFFYNKYGIKVMYMWIP